MVPSCRLLWAKGSTLPERVLEFRDVQPETVALKNGKNSQQA
jgi:hypothetical protein